MTILEGPCSTTCLTFDFFSCRGSRKVTVAGRPDFHLPAVRLQAVRLSEIDYHLPPTQIAQRPLERRDASRLLLVERHPFELQDRRFAELPLLLRGHELLIVNNTRVIPARLLGHRTGVRAEPPSRATRREHLTGEIEVLLTRQLDGEIWEVLVRPGRKIPTGEILIFGEGQLKAEVIARGRLGLRTVRFTSSDGRDTSEHIDTLGHIPLPPYIRRADELADRERYQTVYAKRPGAIAAPTAGLHFTPEVLDEMAGRGVEISELTLNVGMGTFQPIHSETLEGHVMHQESYEIPPETVERIIAARAAGRPILAVGTTVVRALEDAALRALDSHRSAPLLSGKAEARLFIVPGFSFRVVDALLTNFHLPKSTLLALVCAFAGVQ